MATINYDGSFLLCCCDWNKDILFGNIKEKTVNEIWNNEKYEKVRYLLNKGRRDLIKTCFYCNARSHRVGLTGYRGRRYEETKLK
ncbi:MAG: hypothetical protein GWN64_07810 [Candidatus Thorarchaeota archaeon]|nr:hypothetical protein [Candidatus Thorarchaeota archaeon]